MVQWSAVQAGLDIKANLDSTEEERRKKRDQRLVMCKREGKAM